MLGGFRCFSATSSSCSGEPANDRISLLTLVRDLERFRDIGRLEQSIARWANF
jgi:hypothetical protein